MSVLEQFVATAREARKTIVLPEGQDPRVIKAAEMLIANEVAASVIVIGTPDEIEASCQQAGITNPSFETINHLEAPELETFSAQFAELRKKKGITLDQAREAVSNRIFFGSLMTRNGMADGLVAGSIASTADMLRAAFTCIGTAPGMQIASSCFIMDLAQPTPSGDEVLLYADCGVNPAPNGEQLVDIAAATAQTCRQLLKIQPKVAFLAFSTAGSAEHDSLTHVVEASRQFKARIARDNLDVVADGEMQADAALVPGVAAKKAPQSAIQGDANVLIFPDLNSGNIAYKLTQRLAGAGAYGPILQGLNKPLNDLSRGCSPEDIYAVAAITACQAIDN